MGCSCLASTDLKAYARGLFVEICAGRTKPRQRTAWCRINQISRHCRWAQPGSRAIAAPPGEDNDAQSFAQSRTLRIRHLHGLNFSTVASTSPLRAVAILPLNDFHEVSRAAGPK